MNYCGHIKCPYPWVILLLTYISGVMSGGIECFQCTVAPPLDPRQGPSQICSQFDGSSHFQTYCPKSTLCMKRTIYHTLGNGSTIVTSVERGCAPQLDVFRSFDFNQRAWLSQEKIVQSAYQEGCFTGEDRGAPGGPPEYCYCQYPMCNQATIINGDYHIIYFFILILVSTLSGFQIS